MRIGLPLAVLFALGAIEPAMAQEQIIGPPPPRVDIAPRRPPTEPTVDRECQRRQEAALITGEIIVCGERERNGGEAPYDREAARDRFANRTRNAGSLPTPEVAGAGIFRGPATVGGLCVPGMFNCPKPPALIVDVTKLPEAPPGSDADRISRGLEPLGEDEATIVARQQAARQREEMGLPAPVSEPGTAPVSEPSASPAGSAAPAGPR